MTSRRLLAALVLLVVAVFGLGVYVLRLVQKAQQVSPVAMNAHPVAPSVAGLPTRVELFVAADDEGTLRRGEVSVALPSDPPKRAREVLKALLAQYQAQSSTHPLEAGADINDVYLVGDSLAVVDTNEAFADTHRSGILVEELTLASMAQTLAANLPAITRMKLLVDGKERATLAGHASLSEPYEVSDAARLVK